MKPHIEIVDPADPTVAKHLGAILNAYAHEPGGQGEPIVKQALAHLGPGLAANPCSLVFFAYLDDQPVGAAVCFVGFSTFAGKPLVNLHDFAVLPAYRGQGVGRELFDALEQYARERDFAKITLEVHDANERAMKLYRSLGFGPWESPTWFLSKKL